MFPYAFFVTNRQNRYENPFYGHVLKMLKHERVAKKNLIEGFNVFKKKCFITF